MILENKDFGVGGNVNFFTEENFILMNTKITTLNQKRKLCSKYLHSNKVDIRNAFWDLNKYMTKSCPSWTSPPPKKKKIEIFLSQLLIISDIQNLPLYICFWGWQKGWNILKKITYHQSCQNPRWPPIMVKYLFLVKSINMPFLMLP